MPKFTAPAFSLTIPSSTDIWRKAATNDFNAPVRFPTGDGVTCRFPVSKFSSAKLSFKPQKPWQHRYDQAGILLLFMPRGETLYIKGPAKVEEAGKERRWVKAGVEFYQEKEWASVVGRDRFSDWSVAPLPEGGDGRTIEVAKEGGAMWVFVVGENGERTPLREIAWVYDGNEGEVDVIVGGYGARPKDGVGEMEVDFWGWEVITNEE